MYLDVDVIIREDVTLLWQQVTSSDKMIQVVERLVASSIIVTKTTSLVV